MFWGLIMEPNRRYTQTVTKGFHISMAAMDSSTSTDEPSQVMCGMDGRIYLLCTLRKPDMLQCHLDLNFAVGTLLSFSANGHAHIHLTGYVNEEFSDSEEEEEGIKQEPGTSTSANKRAVTNNTDSGPSPVKKPNNSGLNTSNESNAEAENDSDDSDYVATLLGNTLDDDEDDSDASVDEEEEEAEEEDSGDAIDESSLSEDNGEEEEDEEEDEDEEDDIGRKFNGVGHTKTEKQKKKKDKKNKEKQTDEVKKTPQKKKEPKTPNKENQTPKKKSLQGGVIVEDLKEGKGPIARNGKFVNVFYEGRLKQNNKMFDSTMKGAGFSFRLGNGEVIKGWDVGVAGMRVGGKRRITCPPTMAYGQKGSPPAIPPNSTLVFEVELRKIN